MVDKPLPQLPGGPDPAHPVPRAPVHGVDLQEYARIAATLAERPGARAAILGEHRLDELRWIDIEKTWLLRVATGALQQDLSLAADLDASYSAAQAAMGSAEPTRTLEEYAVLTARIERGADTATVLAAAGLSLADWARLCRAWATRLGRDPALSAAFRTMVAAAPP